MWPATERSLTVHKDVYFGLRSVDGLERFGSDLTQLRRQVWLVSLPGFDGFVLAMFLFLRRG